MTFYQNNHICHTFRSTSEINMKQLATNTFLSGCSFQLVWVFSIKFNFMYSLISRNCFTFWTANLDTG